MVDFRDVYVRCLDSDGITVWWHRLGCPPSYEQGKSLVDLWARSRTLGVRASRLRRDNYADFILEHAREAAVSLEDASRRRHYRLSQGERDECAGRAAAYREIMARAARATRLDEAP